MTNWLVPAIWILGFFYTFYDIFTDCGKELKELGDKVKQVAEDQPGKTAIFMILMAFALNVVALCWPIITIADLGMKLYNQIRSKA
jgi:hypothetical protein